MSVDDAFARITSWEGRLARALLDGTNIQSGRKPPNLDLHSCEFPEPTQFSAA
jgi:hypothetical protein